MKKNLLALGSLLLSLTLNSQVLTYVGADALMTVQDGALVYSGGSWQNANRGVVNNMGDIMVVAPASETNTVFAIADGADFRLKYQDSDTYGQLYINGVAQANITGKVTKEYKADANHGKEPTPDNVGGGRQQLGLPFYNLSVQDLMAFFPYLQVSSNTLNSSGRFNYASAFKWNNRKVRFDQLLAGAMVGKPTDYVIIPRRNRNGSQWNPSTDLKEFKGTPYSDQDGTNIFTLDVMDPSYVSDLGSGGNKKNAYYERYKSYLNDPFEVGTVASNWESTGNYGKKLSQFANPFLTNLDLTNLKVIGGAALANIKGIAYYGSNDFGWFYANQPGSGGYTGTLYSNGNLVQATASGGSLQAGDVDKKFVIKPMGEVMVKLSTASSVQVNLNDARSFSQDKRSANNYDVANRNTSARIDRNARSFSENENESLVDDYSVDKRVASIPTDKIVKQIGVTLLSADGKEIGRTFYAVSPSAVTGGLGTTFQGYVDNYPIYTKEEKAEGGEDTNYTAQLYINEANETNFKGKEIPMYINYQYPATLRFDVFEAGVKLQPGENLTSGNFYIKNGDAIVKINSGDTMIVDHNYYGLYFEQPKISAFRQGSIVANNSFANTVIAKKESDWVVRFSKNWKSADIEVYSGAGQLLYSKKNISTSQDYLIPLSAETNGMYVVRVISDNGEVVTQKIVK